MSALDQVNVDFELPGRLVSKILNIPGFEHISSDFNPTPRWVNVNSRDSGIKRIEKCNTIQIKLHYGNYMLKFLSKTEADHEMNCYNDLKDILPLVKHEIHDLTTCTMLVRGPVTEKSLGDYVYSHLVNLTEDAPKVPDKSDAKVTSEIQDELHYAIESSFENLDKLREGLIKHNIKLPITLDNIDCNGLLYDFGDYNTGPHNIDIALSDLMRLYSMTHKVPPSFTKKWFKYDTDLKSKTWVDKVLQVNNNLLHALTTSTELFIDTETCFTTSYYNPVIGYSVVNEDVLSKTSTYLQNLYHLQDPSLRFRRPVLNYSTSVNEYSYEESQGEKAKAVYYNEDAYDYFSDALGDLDDVFKYTYYQSDSSGVVGDIYYYDYQPKLFLQPHILKFLYERTLSDFSCCATDKRFSYDDCIPRNSSLGPSTVLLRSIKQKQVYNGAPDDFIEELVELSAKTPLIFCTKVSQKFALTKKARARTVAACSMFSSTLFRALHKPVTANFVSQAQDPTSKIHHLIGVSKFHHGFNTYFKNRYGNLEDYKVFGSDYTKCDRSFPIVLRAASAAILFELGGWDHETYHFNNEMQAVVFDFLLSGNTLYSKPGGTSSGDATTAFSNTLYNHMVHLYVQLITLASSEVDPKHQLLKGSAVKALQTGDFVNYNNALDFYNSKCYHFNFLSDDSFILTSKQDPTLPDIYNKHNFSRKLETLLHTTVDESKAWEMDGGIHEFCSAEVKEVHGVLQYIPDKNRVLASLIINSECHDLEMQVIRAAAVCAESAIYYSVDPPFWAAVFGYFQKLISDYMEKYQSIPVPVSMIDQNFYLALISDKDTRSEEIMNLLFADYDMANLQSSYQICYTCNNPTVSCCQSCPVPYPLCSYCAYAHYIDTKHLVTHLPTCTHPNCLEIDPSLMCFTLVNSKFTTRCHEHATDYRIPILDADVGSFRLPLAQQCCSQNSSIKALSDQISDSSSINYFAWNSDETEAFNYTQLLHHSYLIDVYSEESEQVMEYTVIDATSYKISIPGAKYGQTTYANILDEQGRQRLTCTLDPLPGSTYVLTLPDSSMRFTKYNKIKRAAHNRTLVRPTQFDILRKATFILGPPGTGKTTFVKENYFKNATVFNKVLYTAPTHKLVQDMDSATSGDNNVTVFKSKLNNRTFDHTVDDTTKPIILSTVNVVRPTAGSLLIIDEVSLLSPLNIVDTVTRSKAANIILLGDPFQLAPVTPNAAFSWDYNTFYLTKLVREVKTLSTCYRCPSNIFNCFAGIYHKHNIQFFRAREGGELKIVPLSNSSPKTDLNVLKSAADFVGTNGVILCNYNESVTIGRANNFPVQTIDSAQGITAARVAVVIFGDTKFSKVLNRLVVALSRATDALAIYASKPVLQVVYDNLMVDDSWKTDSMAILQSITPEFSLEPTTIDYLSRNIQASAICDIEFYHLQHPGEPNFLGIGEISLLTSRSIKTYLRPKYAKGEHYHEVEDSAIRVHGIWKYMKNHLPTVEQSDFNLNILLQFINKTTDLSESPLIFITYNGESDRKALLQLTAKSQKCYVCENLGEDKDARFIGKKQNCFGPICQQHAQDHHLTALVNPKIYNISRPRNLQFEHDKICSTYHGSAHSASVDVIMTSCILASELMPLLQVQDVVINCEGHNFIKTKASQYEPTDRHYGNLHISSNKLIENPREPQFIKPPPNKYHSSDFELGSTLTKCIKSCHPTSNVHYCTSCIDYASQWYHFSRARNADGYEYQPDMEFQLNTTQKQMKLSASIVQKPTGLYVILGEVAGSNSGRLYKYYQSLDQTIIKAYYEKDTALPTKEVLVGLQITCAINCAHAYLPCRNEDDLQSYDIPLVYQRKVNFKGTQYVLTNGNKTPSTAAFMVGLSENVFINTSGTEVYHLQKFTNNEEESMPETLFSTGRLHLLSKHVFPGEDTIRNIHIQQGEYSFTSKKIGGAHCYPNSYLHPDNQIEVVQVSETPLWHATVVQGTGIKIYNSVCDVQSNDLLTAIEQLIGQETISLKTTISIDYQKVPIMIWAEKGNIKTAYLQAGGLDVKSPKRAFTEDYLLFTPQIFPAVKDFDEPIPTRYIKDFITKQPGNISKFQQICSYIQKEIKLIGTPKVLNIGAATSWHLIEQDNSTDYNGIPIGGIVVDYYFKGNVEHSDIRPINDCNNAFKTSQRPTGKFDLIISDIWNEGDNTGILIDLINNNLSLGGSILFKTTKRSYIQNIGSISASFGKLQFMATRANCNSSEVFVVFKYKGSDIDITKLQPDSYNYLKHIYFKRQTELTIPLSTPMSLEQHRPTPGMVVPSWMEFKITKDQWKSGNLKQSCL